jgi:hypothetical protein
MDLHLLTPKWDSLRLELPHNKCRILDNSKIGIPYVLMGVADWSGVIIEGSDAEPLHKLNQTDYTKGITLRIAQVNRVVGIANTEQRFVIQVNSKMLRDRYFEGMTLDNIRLIYDYIIQHKIIDFSYEDFLEGFVYDVDLCMDAEAKPEVFGKMLSRLNRSINPNKWRKVNSFNKSSTNMGIEFGKRDSASITNPFCKFYHKGLELVNKVSSDKKTIGEFNREYLGDDMYNVVRLEATFKNRDMFKEYGIPVKSLNDLLSLETDVLKGIITTIVKKNYMDKRAKSSFTEDNVSPKDDLILNLMEYIIDCGETEEYFLSLADMFSGDYTQKSRYRKMIKKLLSNIQFKAKLEQNMVDAKDGDLLGYQFGLWDLKPNT